MRKLTSAILVMILLSTVIGVGAAQAPEGRPVPNRLVSGTPGTGAGTEDILIEQVYDGYGWWASQCFPDLGGCYHTADDFVNTETWSIDLIFVDGDGQIANADALNWYVYTDGGGVPSGTPGDGLELWSLSLAPTAPGVTITGGQVTVDLLVAIGGPVDIPSGHWWLIFYPTMYLNPWGQWGWYTGAPNQYYPAAQWIFGPPWVPQYPGMAFRMEGNAGPGEPDIEIDPLSFYAEQCPDSVTSQTLQICNAGGAELNWEVTEVSGAPRGLAVPPQPALAPGSDDAGSFAAGKPAPRVSGGPDVLIIQDDYPWGYTSTQDILNANGIPFDQVDSSQIPTIDLSPYGLVIIPGNQPGSFYDVWNANIARFETYVNDGGALWLSTCAYSSTIPEPLVPGGVVNATDLDDYNVVVEAGHPWVAGVSSPIWGTAASHDSFSSLAPGSIVVTTAQTSGQPTLVDYAIGAGRVLITGQTLEYGWANGQGNALILQNSLLDMNAWAPADQVPWLSEDPVAGGLNPGGCADVTVTFDSAGLAAGSYTAALEVTSNDPDEPAITVPVEMTVIECGNTLTCGTMVAQGKLDPYGRYQLRWKVEAVDQYGAPVPLVTVDADLTWPAGGPVSRTRITQFDGSARFPWGSPYGGIWTIDVTGMTLVGYSFVDGPNCSQTTVW